MFVYCPHCGHAFFTPSFEWVVRCPHCRYLVPLWHVGRFAPLFFRSYFLPKQAYNVGIWKTHHVTLSYKLGH